MAARITAGALTLASNLGLTVEPITIAGWLKRINATGNDMGCIYHGATNARYNLARGSAIANNAVTQGAALLSSSLNALTGLWVPEAAVFTSSSSRTIWDRVTNSTSNSTSVTSVPLLDTAGIGGHTSSGSNIINAGIIAEVAFYNCAWTQAEYAQFANGVPPGDIRPSNLVSWMRLLPKYGFTDMVSPSNVWTAFGTGQPQLVTDHPPMRDINRKTVKRYFTGLTGSPFIAQPDDMPPKRGGGRFMQSDPQNLLPNLLGDQLMGQNLC